MLTPAVATLLIFFIGPLVVAFLQSFGYAPFYNINTFPTLNPYRELFSLPGFWRSVFYTFYYATLPTIIGTVLSIYLTLVLRKVFWGKKIFLHIYKLPFMLPYLVGVSLTIMLFSNGGLIARLLYALGFIESTQDFPRFIYSHSGWGIMLVYLWKQIPFSTLVLHSILISIGFAKEEAAITLGANRWQVFWHITLPQLMPGIISTTAIIFVFNFGSFEVPFLLGGGFPNTLAVEAWRVFDDSDYSKRLQAMAIVMFISLVSGLLLTSYLSFYRRFGYRL